MKIIFFLILFFFSVLASYSETPQNKNEVQTKIKSNDNLADEFFSLKTLANKDTVIFTRSRGDWWFGVTTGTNPGYYFGDFNLRDNYVRERPIISYNNSFGGGAFFGLFGQWFPTTNNLGALLRLHLIDKSFFNSYSEPYNDSLNTRFKAETSTTYFIIQPSAILRLPVKYFELFTGLDIEILTSSKWIHKTQFDNTGAISQDQPVNIKPEKMRFGGHLGISYDILIADFNNEARVFFTPFIIFSYGTNIFTGYNSSRSAVQARIGFNFKFGFDNVKTDTVPFNPFYVEPTPYLASSEVLRGKILPELITFRPLELKEIAVIVPSLPGITAESPTIDTVTIEKPTPPKAPAIVIRPGEMRRFNYESSGSTQLNERLENYLNYIVEFLRANPKATVRIVGHSDNQGTPEQNRERSIERANTVVRYLQRNGIPLSRIFSRGDGALYPIGDNRTPEGQLMNRRVEITVVQ